MRKRIWRMSEDKFDNRRTKLILPSEKLEIIGKEGGKVSGEFSFSSGDDIPLKGIVYSSNPYETINYCAFYSTQYHLTTQSLHQVSHSLLPYCQ